MNISKAIEDNYEDDLKILDKEIKLHLEKLSELIIQRNKLNLHFFVAQINDRSLSQPKDGKVAGTEGS